MYVLLTLAWVSFGAFMHGAPAHVTYSAPFRSEQACMDKAYDEMAPRRDAYAQAICYSTKDTVTIEPMSRQTVSRPPSAQGGLIPPRLSTLED